MFDALILARLAMGGFFGGMATLAADMQQTDSTGVGVAVFVAFVVLGAIGVFLMDRVVRARMRREYRQWIEAGRPERRTGDRRARREGRRDPA